MKILRTIVTLLLAFILSVSCSLFMLVNVAKTTALSPAFAVKAIEKSNYCSSIHDDLYTEFLSYGYACNIGEDYFDEFFEKILTVDFIKQDIEKYIIDLYSDPKAEIDTGSLLKSLKTSLKEYAVANGYGSQSSIDEDVDRIAEELSATYKGYLSLPAVSTISAMLTRIDHYYIYAFAGSLALSVISFIIIFISYKKKTLALMYIVSSCIGSFLIMLAFPMYLRLTNVIGKINITGKAIYSLVVTYTNSLLETVLVYSAVPFILAVILLIIYLKKAKKETE